jgi:hypothetical protein
LRASGAGNVDVKWPWETTLSTVNSRAAAKDPSLAPFG